MGYPRQDHDRYREYNERPFQQRRLNGHQFGVSPISHVSSDHAYSVSV
jgi:hypothetical protein